MTDIARIAGELSEAVAKAVQGDPARLVASTSVLLELCLRDLASVRADNTVYLTPLGLSVAQHIKEMGT